MDTLDARPDKPITKKEGKKLQQWRLEQILDGRSGADLEGHFQHRLRIQKFRAKMTKAERQKFDEQFDSDGEGEHDESD